MRLYGNKCSNSLGSVDRDFIESKQVMTFDKYIEMWEKSPGIWK